MISNWTRLDCVRSLWTLVTGLRGCEPRVLKMSESNMGALTPQVNTDFLGNGGRCVSV